MIFSGGICDDSANSTARHIVECCDISLSGFALLVEFDDVAALFPFKLSFFSWLSPYLHGYGLK